MPRPGGEGRRKSKAPDRSVQATEAIQASSPSRLAAVANFFDGSQRTHHIATEWLSRLSMPVKIHILKGDITEMAVDAIVNAANTDLLLGAGVAGAIRRKGGPRLQEECDRIGPIAMGEAAVTTGGNLRALYVIHAASMRLGGRTTPESLRASVRNSLERAEEKAFQSIAFPAIGTGIAGFPMEACAGIMIEEVLNHLKSRTSLQRIYFVLYDDAALKAFEDSYRDAIQPPTG